MQINAINNVNFGEIRFSKDVRELFYDGRNKIQGEGNSTNRLKEFDRTVDDISELGDGFLCAFHDSWDTKFKLLSTRQGTQNVCVIDNAKLPITTDSLKKLKDGIKRSLWRD